MSNNELTPQSGSALPILSGSGQLPAKVQKQTEHGVAKVVGRAIVQAAQVQAAAFVAHTALTQVAMLSAEEAALSAADPIAADRYAAIVNDYVFVARHIVRRIDS
jgi:hypothetical protein